MTLAVIYGIAAGTGLFLVIYGLVPRKPTAAEALAALVAPPQIASGHVEGGWTAYVGRPAVRLLAAVGLPPAGIRRDLALLERTAERHLAEKVTLAFIGACIAPAVAGLWALGGAPPPIAVPLWAALILAVGGFFIPDLGVHGDAVQRRRDFTHALSAYLDLVVVALAGSTALDGALNDAASVGRGWAFARIRQTLTASRLVREEPWDALGDLGRELDISPLRELAASVSLAGTEGAKVRATLATKADALRERQISEAESSANAANERMSVALVALFAGFLVFVLYPGVALFLQIQ